MRQHRPAPFVRAVGRGPCPPPPFAFCLVLLAFSATACLDGQFVNLGMKDRSRELPDAADNLVAGVIEGAPAGASIAVFSGGDALEGVTATFPGDGGFRLAFPGNTEFAGLRVEARWPAAGTAPGGQTFGVVPVLAKQRSVMCNPRLLACLGDPEGLCPEDFQATPPECRSGGGPAVMPALGPESTAYTLVLLGKGFAKGTTLASASCVLPDQVAELQALRAGNDPAVVAFVELVDGWLQFAGRDGRYPFAGELPSGATARDLVDGAFLDAFAAQLPKPQVGCGGAAPSDPATPGDQLCAFTSALNAAADAVQVTARYATDRTRVVFLADFRAGARDGNCAAVDRFKWATDLPGKKVFLAAGIHKTTPVCGTDVTTGCIAKAQVDAANEVLGNWVPNLREMSDDGTKGDAVSGDGIWTFVADLPLLPVDDALRQAGVRVGYKYTYGFPGQGWTDAEEWPGNQRLLELVDVNGDGLVARLDVFGDEASNKDKANQLLPANGGCGGLNLWESDGPGTCAKYLHDTRERKVDLDGDAQCLPDAWPSAGAVSPITLDCE